MSKQSAKFAHPLWARERELGQRMFLGHSDIFHKSLYSSLEPCIWWDGGEKSRNEHGGIFSLEFSSNGSYLVAGCEKRSFLMFDPLSRKLIHTVKNAHPYLITKVKFLDSCLFATGSVDSTIRLWDARNLKSRIQNLRGHSDAIQNIEFSPKNNLLITSAHDGICCAWDMTNCRETEVHCRKIFRSEKPLRVQLSPDESKMIIFVPMGYLIIVHDLDLNEIAEVVDELEMLGFTSLREEAARPARNASRRRRNRVEVMEDFPCSESFKTLSTLAIHPQGGSLISRCRCVKNDLQWICVHDIREKEPAAEEAEYALSCPLCRDRPESDGNSGSSSAGSSTRSGDTSGTENILSTTDESSSDELEDWVAQQLRPVFEPFPEEGTWRGRVGSHETSARSRPPSPSPASPPDLASPGSSPATSSAVASSLVLTRPSSGEPLLNRRVHGHTPRMTHYIQEPVTNKWYYGNLCVSADGRLICSPLDCGIKLLSFSPQCSELPVYCSGREPILLHELKTYISHKNTVCSARFSPRHLLLVSGCLSGKLAWYQPVV